MSASRRRRPRTSVRVTNRVKEEGDFWHVSLSGDKKRTKLRIRIIRKQKKDTCSFILIKAYRCVFTVRTWVKRSERQMWPRTQCAYLTLASRAARLSSTYTVEARAPSSIGDSRRRASHSRLGSLNHTSDQTFSVVTFPRASAIAEETRLHVAAERSQRLLSRLRAVAEYSKLNGDA